MSTQVAIIGANGFIGSALYHKLKTSLLLKDVCIITLSHKTLEPLYHGSDSFERINPDDYKYYELDNNDSRLDNYEKCNITPNESLANILSVIRHFDVLINLAGNGRQSALCRFEDSIVRTASLAVFLAQRAGIPNIVHMSGLGASLHTPIAYLAAKYAAECVVVESKLNHVVLRPSYVVGGQQHTIAPQRRRMDYLSSYVHKHKISGTKEPLDIFNCNSLIQPIHIDDVTNIIIWAIKKLVENTTFSTTLDLVGPDCIPFFTYMSLLAKAYDVEINPVSMEALYKKALSHSSKTDTIFGVDDLGVIAGGFVSDHTKISQTTGITLFSVVKQLETVGILP